MGVEETSGEFEKALSSALLCDGMDATHLLEAESQVMVENLKDIVEGSDCCRKAFSSIVRGGDCSIVASIVPDSVSLLSTLYPSLSRSVLS